VKKNKTQKRRGGGMFDWFLGKKPETAVTAPTANAPAVPSPTAVPAVPVAPASVTQTQTQPVNAEQQQPGVAVMGGKRFKKSKSSKKLSKK
jgi:hypothetical protein